MPCGIERPAEPPLRIADLQPSAAFCKIWFSAVQEALAPLASQVHSAQRGFTSAVRNEPVSRHVVCFVYQAFKR